MKKIALIIFLFSVNAWSSNCTEHASFLLTLKLKDMISAYGGQYYYEKINKDPWDMNRFSFAHICKNDEIQMTIEGIEREHFKVCKLENIEMSLDESSQALRDEEVSQSVRRYLDLEDCAPKVSMKIEDQYISMVKVIDHELSSSKVDYIKVCNISRELFKENFELRKSCN